MPEFVQPDCKILSAEKEIRIRLTDHIAKLADEIGERNIWHLSKLNAAADYITGEWQQAGFEVGRQQYESRGTEVANLEVEIPGRKRADEIVIIGAHYDSVIASPGANDNASGVAALLELSRLLFKSEFSRTLRLVAFVNEEPPFFKQDEMGSRVYARQCRLRNEKIVAMLSLETIGYYSANPHSQNYPFPLGLFYPGIANFIGFVGNRKNRRLVKYVLDCFRKHSSFPAEGVAAPGWIMGIGWSDHWSFWQEGYPALMVTDTALFRYESYHSSLDTPEKIDYPRLAAVVVGLSRLVQCIGNSENLL